MNFRKIFGEFATGVCVIASGDENNQPFGVTINSFTSVSIAPPLVLYCMKTAAESFENVMSSKRFSINILAADQMDLAKKCTIRGGHKLEDGAFEFSKLSIPIITDAIATIECEHFNTHPGGDHTIIIAQVLNIHHNHQGDPLIFHRSSLGARSNL